MKKLLGLYNFKSLIDKGYTIEQISEAIFKDVKKQSKALKKDEAKKQEVENMQVMFRPKKPATKKKIVYQIPDYALPIFFRDQGFSEEQIKKLIPIDQKENFKIYTGKNIKGIDYSLYLDKEHLHTIFLSGSTGSGKSIFHYSMYKQMMEQNTPDELGFVFMDMTQVDFPRKHSPYLYLPIIYSSEQALNSLEMLANESELRNLGKSDNKRAIVIHIEECDMIALDQIRFEKAWVKIARNKDKSNMYLIFSTSRPSIDIFTKTIRDNTDLKVVFNVSSEYDSKNILGKSIAEKLEPWKKVLAYDNKEIVINSFTDEYVKELQQYWEKMSNTSA